MRYRTLGRTGLRVSEFFLGGMTFGHHTAGASEQEAARLVDAYADAGGNVIDTADAYGQGRSETLLGTLLRGRRDRFVLATKFGITRDPTDPNAAGAHRKSLRLALEASLRRLNTDHIDLYWVHFWDRRTPVEETISALDDAVRAGKVLHIGFSDTPAWVTVKADTLAQCRGWTPLSAVQVPYNLLRRDVEREILPMARSLGLTVAAWGPLAHGALAADTPRRADSSSLGSRERDLLERVRRVAAELEATPAQVALAWLRARSDLIHPIVGAGTLSQLVDSMAASTVTLPETALRELTENTGLSLGFPHDFLAEVEQDALGAAAPPPAPR